VVIVNVYRGLFQQGERGLKFFAPFRIQGIRSSSYQSCYSSLNEGTSARHAWEPGKIHGASVQRSANARSLEDGVPFRVLGPQIFTRPFVPRRRIVVDPARK